MSEDGTIATLNGQKFIGKFTDALTGQNEFSSWKKEGRQYLAKLAKDNKKARGKDTTDALEESILTKLRGELGLTFASAEEERKAKRRKKKDDSEAEDEDAEDMDEDLFDF